MINPQTMMLGQEPRQTTSNLGHLNKPSIQALIHGLNRHYYSIAINYRHPPPSPCSSLTTRIGPLVPEFSQWPFILLRATASDLGI